MNNFPQVANVKIAAQPKSKFNLGTNVITTQDFGVITPILSREVVPDDSWHIVSKTQCRLAPLPAPTFGNCIIKTYGFFVPYRLCMRGFEQLITNTTLSTVQGNISPSVPYFTNNILFGLFQNTSFGLATEEGQTSHTVDFYDDNGVGFNFTTLGKRIYNLLVNLGYKVNFTENDTTKMSLLPLLAYCRVYSDWFFPSQYYPSDPLRPYFDQTNLVINNLQDLWEILENVGLFGFLQKDLFTSAWKDPNGPIGENAISVKSYDFGTGIANGQTRITTDSLEGSSTPNGGARLDASGYGLSAITQYGLNFLKATQNFLNRNMLAGNRYIEQLLARYGVRVPDAVIQRSEFLGSSVQYVEISDVMSTADTSTGSVGEYAGKGISYGEGKFNFEAKEFGQIFVFSVIEPLTGYVQGRKAESGIFHLDRLSFFTPEYDALGTQPIRNDMLYSMYNGDQGYSGGQSHGGKPDGIFGYAPTYYEYKTSTDVLSGDFVVPHLAGADMPSYHLFRLFEEPSANDPLALNLSFMNINGPGNDFDRIFQVSNNSYDHFYMTHRLDITAIRPMKSLGDSIVTDNHHGREVNLPYNGYNL